MLVTTMVIADEDGPLISIFTEQEAEPRVANWRGVDQETVSRWGKTAMALVAEGAGTLRPFIGSAKHMSGTVVGWVFETDA